MSNVMKLNDPIQLLFPIFEETCKMATWWPPSWLPINRKLSCLHSLWQGGIHYFSFFLVGSFSRTIHAQIGVCIRVMQEMHQIMPLYHSGARVNSMVQIFSGRILGHLCSHFLDCNKKIIKEFRVKEIRWRCWWDLNFPRIWFTRLLALHCLSWAMEVFLLTFMDLHLYFFNFNHF